MWMWCLLLLYFVSYNFEARHSESIPKHLAVTSSSHSPPSHILRRIDWTTNYIELNIFTLLTTLANFTIHRKLNRVKTMPKKIQLVSIRTSDEHTHTQQKSGNIVIFIHYHRITLCRPVGIFFSRSASTGHWTTIKLNDAEIFNFSDNLQKWPLVSVNKVFPRANIYLKCILA